MRLSVLVLALSLVGMGGDLQAATRKPRPRKTRAVKAAPKAVEAKTTLNPVSPLPLLPTARPASLTHLERLLPSTVLLAIPGGTVAAPVGGEDHKSMAAQMRPVLPPTETGLETPRSEAKAEVGSLFDPADPDKLDLLWPVATRTVSSAWGPRIRTRTVRVKTKTNNRKIRQRYRGNHRGVDLTAPKGTDVYAAMDGVVIESGRHKDYGNFVVVDHGNGVTTLYGHHNRNFAKAGDVVRRGQKIAEVGRTGRATGNHLHFELRINGVHQNPLPVMNDVEEIPAELMALNETAVAPKNRR
ncbi:MAG: M23 family metallopeptidase [Firmicutes bacterium]|nr:M23 family metallopeptidase [Bacillota bacterium]